MYREVFPCIYERVRDMSNGDIDIDGEYYSERGCTIKDKEYTFIVAKMMYNDTCCYTIINKSDYPTKKRYTDCLFGEVRGDTIVLINMVRHLVDVFFSKDIDIFKGMIDILKNVVRREYPNIHTIIGDSRQYDKESYDMGFRNMNLRYFIENGSHFMIDAGFTTYKKSIIDSINLYRDCKLDLEILYNRLRRYDEYDDFIDKCKNNPAVIYNGMSIKEFGKYCVDNKIESADHIISAIFYTYDIYIGFDNIEYKMAI